MATNFVQVSLEPACCKTWDAPKQLARALAAPVSTVVEMREGWGRRWRSGARHDRGSDSRLHGSDARTCERVAAHKLGRRRAPKRSRTETATQWVREVMRGVGRSVDQPATREEAMSGAWVGGWVQVQRCQSGLSGGLGQTCVVRPDCFEWTARFAVAPARGVPVARQQARAGLWQAVATGKLWKEQKPPARRPQGQPRKVRLRV